MGSTSPQTEQSFGYTPAITMDGDAKEGAKQPHCWYRGRCGRMWRQKSEGSTPARLLCHLKYMLPLQTEVLPPTRPPDFMWLPWRAPERKSPPLHALLTYQLLYRCRHCTGCIVGMGREIGLEYTSLGTSLG